MRAIVLAALLATACRFEGGRFHEASDAAVDDAPVDADPLLAGCEGRWMFDEDDWGSGVRDSCGGDDPGTPIGDAHLELDALRGQVARPANGCIQVPDSPRLRPTAAFTIALWVNPDCPCTSEGLVTKRFGYMDHSAYAMYLEAAANGEHHLWVDVDTENDRFEHTADTFATTWRHLALVFDGTRPSTQRVAIYVDGAFRAFAPETSSAIAPPGVDPAPPVSIGCLPNGGATLGGTLDDVTIWSRALSTSEVQAWYAAGLIGT